MQVGPTKMMDGTKMTRAREEKRLLDSYLSRRNVVDVAAWLEQAGINSMAGLQNFCESANLRADFKTYEKYFTVDQAKPVPSSEPKKAKASDKTWHTPAAERPLRKKSTKTPRKTSSRKKK